MQRFLDRFGAFEMFRRHGLPINQELPGAPQEIRGADIRQQRLRSCRTGG